MSKSVFMFYKNWKGQTGLRKIVPNKIEYKATEYHPEPQWILNAYDISKGADRDFALRDCQFLGHQQ